MDKTVLLVLLSLQVLLVISAFTATDAAALMMDDQSKPPLQLKETAYKHERPKYRIWGGCSRKTGGCNPFVKPDPTQENPDIPELDQTSPVHLKKQSLKPAF